MGGLGKMLHPNRPMNIAETSCKFRNIKIGEIFYLLIQKLWLSTRADTDEIWEVKAATNDDKVKLYWLF